MQQQHLSALPFIVESDNTSRALGLPSGAACAVVPKGWIWSPWGRTSTWFVRIAPDRRAEVTLGPGLGVSMFNFVLSVPLAQGSPFQAGPARRAGHSPGHRQVPACWDGSQETHPRCLALGPCQAHPTSLTIHIPLLTYCIFTQEPLTQSTAPVQMWELKGKAPCATAHDTSGARPHLWNRP